MVEMRFRGIYRLYKLHSWTYRGGKQALQGMSEGSELFIPFSIYIWVRNFLFYYYSHASAPDSSPNLF